MKLSTRVITSAACVAAALLLTPAAAWAIIPAPEGAGHVQPAPARVVAQPTTTTTPKPPGGGGTGAVQMAVAMAIGAAVATAVRRRRPSEPQRVHGIVEPFPHTADVLVKD